MLTFDGRIKEGVVGEALSVSARAIFETAGDAKLQVGEPAPAPVTGGVCYVGLYGYGRPYLAMTPPTCKGSLLAGWVELSPDERGAIGSRAAELATAMAQGDQDVAAFYEGLDSQGAKALLDNAIAGKPGSVGIAAGIEIHILAGDLQPLPPEELGEIALRGDSVIVDGYFDDGSQRHEVFLEEGWFLTGDMGYLDEDGHLFITGRLKNMVIRGGEKLYLEDLDRCLGEHPSVADVCCVRVAGAPGREGVVAFVVAATSPTDDGVLIRHAQQHLGGIGRPDELVWVERIPRSAGGKPLREAMRVWHRDGDQHSCERVND